MIIHIGQRKKIYRMSCLAYKAYACEWNLRLSVERMNESVSYNLFGLPCLFQFSFNVMSISWHCMFLLEAGRELNFWWSKNIIRSIAPHIFTYNFIINLIVLEYTCVCVVSKFGFYMPIMRWSLFNVHWLKWWVSLTMSWNRVCGPSLWDASNSDGAPNISWL